MRPRLVVQASGLVTALGYNAPATLAALRAGISAVRETPWSDHVSGEPLKGTRVSLPQWWFGVGMLADLVAPAIHECLTAAGSVPASEIPILVSVSPADRPGRPERLDHALLDELHARLDLPPHPRSRLFPCAQAGGVQALLAAREIIARNEARQVIVAGVDSFLHTDTLDAFMARRRLMTPSNSNGFYPGEAGAAVLIGTASDGDVLEILGIGIDHEPAGIDSTRAFRGSGMTAACRQALAEAGVGLCDVAYRLTDLSGEHYKFKEAHFVAGRLDSATRSGPLDLWHPIEYLGEIGAAILPCLLAQALHAGQEGYAPGPRTLCHVGSDAGERGAVVVAYRANQGDAA